MFERTALTSLHQWIDNKKRKPLVLRGARQVGKTTLVKMFSKSFDRFIHLNLDKKEHAQLFDQEIPFHELVSAIFYHSRQPRDDKRTLIFIDEIQNSANAINTLRYFYEEAPEIYVIAAGSLLESLIDNKISFPVGRVEYVFIRPCSFIEFLMAMNDKNSLEMLSQEKIPAFAHGDLMSLFNKYALIGGMPEVINQYIETNDLIATNKIYTSLLTGYSDDVEKYARNQNQIQHIRHILKTGMAFAGQRIAFEQFGSSNYRSREIGEAFRTLEKAMLLEITYPITSSVIPIIPNLKKSPRLSWFDTGLVNFTAGVQHEVFQAKEISNAWRGIVAEHVTGQELLTLNNDILTQKIFWIRDAKSSSAEVDFIYPFNGLLIPVEVKSGEGTRLKSLHFFMDSAPHTIAVRIWSSPFSITPVTTPSGKEISLINIPFYLIHKIPQILGQYL